MNAFAAASAALHADPNRSAAAHYTPKGGVPVPLRVITSQPEEPIVGLTRTPGASARRVQVSLDRGDVSQRPGTGATVQLDGEDEILTVQEVTTNNERTRWLCTCSAAPAGG